MKTSITERFKRWKEARDQPDPPCTVNGVEMEYKGIYDVAMKNPVAMLSILESDGTTRDIPAQLFIDEHLLDVSTKKFRRNVFWPCMFTIYASAFTAAPLDSVIPGIWIFHAIIFVIAVGVSIAKYGQMITKKEREFDTRYKQYYRNQPPVK